jgi:hypothetical protein
MVPGISSTQPTNHPLVVGLMIVWYRCFTSDMVDFDTRLVKVSFFRGELKKSCAHLFAHSSRKRCARILDSRRRQVRGWRAADRGLPSAAIKDLDDALNGTEHSKTFSLQKRDGPRLRRGFNSQHFHAWPFPTA